MGHRQSPPQTFMLSIQCCIYKKHMLLYASTLRVLVSGFPPFQLSLVNKQGRTVAIRRGTDAHASTLFSHIHTDKTQTHTNTSTYHANVFVTYFHSHRCLDALPLRVFVQIIYISVPHKFNLKRGYDVFQTKSMVNL